MGIENVVSAPAHQDPNRLGGIAKGTLPKNNGKARRSAKETERLARLHGKLMGWYYLERDKQGPNRVEMAIDEDFYDGIQWNDEDIAELDERGQAPLVFNQVKPTINWLLGTERRTRIDGKVLPRTSDDENMAEVKTKLLKYLSDVNKTPWTRSQAFKSQIVAGIGWMEDAINTDPTAELLVTRHVDWKQIYHDSDASTLDTSEMRYIFRWAFLDLDQAQALCPGFTELLAAAAVDSTQVAVDDDNVWYLGARLNADSTGDYAAVTRRGMAGSGATMGREKVKLIEAWYKVPARANFCRSCDPDTLHLHGRKYDEADAEMYDAMNDGTISVASHVYQEMRVAIMTDTQILFEGPSPYQHNRFPFTPLWCYRRHRDGLPYGVIRDIRDAQRDYNKRASKALYILSTVRVVMEKNAVDDVEQLRREAARPDSVIEVNRGKEFRIEQDKQLAQEHINLMQFDGQMIRDVGGVTDQNLGNAEGSMSGKAIGKLQDQGTVVTAAIFDNMRLAIQLQSEIQLSLIEQYYSAPKVVRIVGENRPIEWLKLNVYDATAAKFINDVTRSAADFVVSEQDFRASMRQAMFESMMDLCSKLPPELSLQLLDMVVDLADVPNKDELVARIRKINGQGDPSRRPTPEEELAQQRKQQKQDALDNLNFSKLQAEVEQLQATSKATLAKLDESAARVSDMQAGTLQKMVTAMYEALQAGQIVMTVPGVTPPADSVLAAAGFKDQGGEGPAIAQPTGALPALTPQSAHGDYVGAAPTSPAPPAAADGAPPAAPDPTHPLLQADGAQQGIETPAADGVTP